MATESLHILVPLYAGVLFVLGLLMGSFLNVVAWRAPQDISLLNPPSTCPKCGVAIKTYDNVPILGYLLLRGKCRACGDRIPPRYLLAEIASGLLWAGVGIKLAYLDLGLWTNIGIGLVWLFFVSTALVTVLTDLDFLIILDEVSIGGMVLALIASPFLPYLHHAGDTGEFSHWHMVLAHMTPGWPAWAWGLLCSVLGAGLGLGFSLVIYFLGNVAFRKQIAAAKEENPEIDSALGMGDVKLMGFYGALFGWMGVFMIFVVGSALGSVIGSGVKIASGAAEGKTGLAGIRNRWHTGTSVIPFGPFLVLGGLVWFFLGDWLAGVIWGV